MIELILATSLLAQDSGFPADITEDFAERFSVAIDAVNSAAEDASDDDSSLAYAQTMVDFVEAAFEATFPERFVLLDQENLVTIIAAEMENLEQAEREDDDMFEFEFNAGAAHLPNGGDDTDGPYCAADDPGKALDQPLTDPQGNELNLRICWTGTRDADTGMLTAAFLYQLQSGNYVVMYNVSLIGNREAGMPPRLAILERIGEPLVLRTVIRPVSAD